MGVVEVTGTTPNTPKPEPYCTGCGHTPDRHRNRRCWTDALGNPLARTRSLIDCKCDTYTTEDQ